MGKMDWHDTTHEDMPLGLFDRIHEHIEAVFVKIASLQVAIQLAL